MAAAFLSATTFSYAGQYDWFPQTVNESVSKVVSQAESFLPSTTNQAAREVAQTAPQFPALSRPDCGEMPLPAGATVEVGFSPDGTAEARALKVIREASSGPGEHTLLVAGYAFTSFDIAKAIVQAKEAGVKVAVVVDAKENENKSSKMRYLAEHGVSVRRDSALKMLHDKFLVSGSTVETGSFNFTRAAASSEHAENAIVLRHVPKVAECYIAHWKMLWDQSTPVTR